MHLHHVSDGAGPDVVVLHGLFGAGGNLGALSRHLAPHYRVHSLDLPDHGRSDWADQASIPRYAAAVWAWVEQQGLSSVLLVGHSLGGKVAMQLALDHPQQVNGLVVADIAPVAYPPSHQRVFAGLRAVAQAAPENRAAARVLMAPHIEESMVIQFLLLSLARGDDGLYRWRFNAAGLERGYASLLQSPTGPAAPVPALFIAGELSDYRVTQHSDAISDLYPNSAITTMAGCGHWLHAQEPALFNDHVSRFLAQLRA